MQGKIVYPKLLWYEFVFVTLHGEIKFQHHIEIMRHFNLKIILVIAFFALWCNDSWSGVMSTPERVVVKLPDSERTKYNGIMPLDEPDVYFNTDEMTLTLHGWDNTLASYYVEVVDYCGVTVAGETVAGYGWQTVYLDPVTSSGTATVTITTSRGDEYSGTFYVP